MGGPSPEFDVSLKSGSHVMERLDPERYEVRGVFIDREGNWDTPPKKLAKETDCAFVALHGVYGEDGTVQSILERHNIPYTGSRMLSSALAMNKFLALQALADHDVRIPVTLFIPRAEWRASSEITLTTIGERVGYPAIIKPNRSGSSIGVSIARNREEAGEALGHLFHSSDEALVQEFVRGREFTCGVVDRGWPESAFALFPTEIFHRDDVWGYHAKYSPETIEMTPPKNLDEHRISEMQKIARRAHEKLGASGCSRTDIIMSAKGALYYLETNTIPGFTRESLLPKAAEASGVPFEKVLDMLVDGAAHHERLRASRPSDRA